MNQIITRRNLLRVTALLPVGYAMGSCGTLPVVGAFVGPIEAIGQQITLDAPQFQSVIATVPAYAGQAASLVSKVTGIDTAIQAAAAAIGAASTQSEGQSTLITIETYMNALAPIVGPPLQAAAAAAFPGGGLVVGLVIAALPAIEPLVNMTVDQLTAEAKALVAYAQVPAPTAEHVRMAATLGGTADAHSALAELLRRAGK